MSYILKGTDEARRLDEQTAMEQFSLERELANIFIPSGAKVLDAGCGSGVLCRYLERTFPDTLISGCDLSESSLKHAKSLSTNSKSTYFFHDMVMNEFPEKYDFIFNRLVAHHLNEEKLVKVFSNFYEALNPGGEVNVIDPDGFFVNLGTKDAALKKMMNRVEGAFHGNLRIGRIIPSLLTSVGFKEVKWRIEVVDFQNVSRSLEVNQWKGRFESAIDFYIQLFGSELEARRFIKLYLAEASREDVPIFFNKFIVNAKKE